MPSTLTRSLCRAGPKLRYASHPTPLRPAHLTKQAYHSNTSPEPSPFSPLETSILSSALSHVPTHGFTETALLAGLRDTGHPEASANLFPRGIFDLIIYHLSTRRLSLKDEVQFLQPNSSQQQLTTTAKVHSLTLQRLRANAPIIQHWQAALSIMAQPAYVPASLRELSMLVDEIWFLAGDVSVDASWYSKRAALAAVYSSAELFMTVDRSEGFGETERFVERRLEEVSGLGGVLGAVGEWTAVSGRSFVNVLRSKGVGI